MPTQVLAIEASEVLERTCDGEPKRMIRIEQLARHVVDVDLLTVLVQFFQNLFADDLFLRPQLLQQRLLNHFREQRDAFAYRFGG